MLEKRLRYLVKRPGEYSVEGKMSKNPNFLKKKKKRKKKEKSARSGEIEYLGPALVNINEFWKQT